MKTFVLCLVIALCGCSSSNQEQANSAYALRFGQALLRVLQNTSAPDLEKKIEKNARALLVVSYWVENGFEGGDPKELCESFVTLEESAREVELLHYPPDPNLAFALGALRKVCAL